MKAEENEPVHRCRRSEKSYAERKLRELTSHSTVPLRRELTSESRLSEKSQTQTKAGQKPGERVTPGTSEGIYGWAGTKASNRGSREEKDNERRPVSWGRRRRRKEEERK